VAKISNEWKDQVTTRLKNVYSTMHHQMASALDLYHLRYGSDTIRVPKGTFVHVPSTAAALVDSSRDQIRTDTPRVRVLPAGTSRTAAETALKQQLAADMFLRRLREDGDQSIPAQIIFDFVSVGAAVAKVVYDIDKVPAAPENSDEESLRAWESLKENTYPFRDEILEPRSVLIPRDESWPYSLAIEMQKRPVAQIKAGRFGKKFVDNSPDQDPLREVDYEEVWTPQRYAVWADGVKLSDKPNPWGIVPFVWGYSGLGSHHKGDDPADAAVGMLTKVESELKAEVRLKTALEAFWQYGVWPRLITQEDPETIRKEMEMGAGGIIQWSGPPEAEPKFLTPPQPNPSMWMFLPEIKESIRQATISEVLQGERPRGVDYGYLQSLLIGQARLRFGPVKHSAELFLKRLLLLKFHMLRVMDHSLSVRGYPEPVERSRRLSASDISGHIELEVELRSGSPFDDAAKLTAMWAITSGGGMSEWVYTRDILELDPAEEAAQKLAEMVEKQAVAAGLLMSEVSEKLAGQRQAGEVEKSNKGIGGMIKSMFNPGAREGVPKKKGLGALGTPGQLAPQQEE
jgi:hypothetical protein